MFERFGFASRAVVVRAHEEAKRLRHTTIGPEHLTLGILDTEPAVLATFGATREQVEGAANSTHTAVDGIPTGHLPFDVGIREIFSAANLLAAVTGSPYVDPRHIAAGIALYAA